jgi:hypothetical protein
MKGNPFSEMTGEILGTIVLGITVFVFIIVLSTLGELTGQNEITNQTINAIYVLFIFSLGIGIPAGVVWIIKTLGGFTNGNYY